MSSRSHERPKSFGADCPAARSSTILTMFAISFFCASSFFFSSFPCPRIGVEDDANIERTTRASTPRRCFIKPSLPSTKSSTVQQQSIIGVRFGSSQTVHPPALQPLPAVRRCAIIRLFRPPHEAHRRLGAARCPAPQLPEQHAVQPRSNQTPCARRQLERLDAAHERTFRHARRRATSLLRRRRSDRGAVAGSAHRAYPRHRSQTGTYDFR